jgi:hypothetical protein
MTLSVGASSYYWSDCARLLVTLIIVILKLERTCRTISAELDIVEFPLNVNGKKFWKAVSGQPSARISDSGADI